MERLWSRAVATGGNRWHSGGRENGEIKRKPFPWVATGCVRRSMVRRGSTVRVRQRALQTARKSDLYFRIDLQVVERGQVWSPLEDNSLRLLIQAARCVRLSRNNLTPSSHTRMDQRRLRVPAARTSPGSTSRCSTRTDSSRDRGVVRLAPRLVLRCAALPVLGTDRRAPRSRRGRRAQPRAH